MASLMIPDPSFYPSPVVSVTVYGWAGLGVLRSAWLNVDAIWIVALLATGVILLLA